MKFSIKSGNMELRSCNESLLSSGPHTTAEVVYWDKDSEDKPYCYCISYWKRDSEGFCLYFVGARPFASEIGSAKFMELAKIGQSLMDAMFIEMKEDN